MKRIVCILLVLLTVIFTSCGKENVYTTDSETAETTTGTTPLTTVQDDIEVLVNDSQSALDIYSMMYYTGTKQEMYISDYLANYELSVMKYSVIDLDGDSHSETVLWLAKGTYEYYGFLILHENGDSVYGYELTYRAFYELKEDGTFSFSAGASDHGIGKIEFTNDTYSIKKIAYCESDYLSQKVSYYIENEAVSQEEFEQYITEHDQKQNTEWHEVEKERIDLNSYIRYLVNYFYEPYTIGDEIHRLDILTLVFHFCYSNRERLDFVKMDETTLDTSQRILIEGEGLRKAAKMLLGENFEAAEHHEFLEYSSENIMRRPIPIPSPRQKTIGAETCIL